MSEKIIRMHEFNKSASESSGNEIKTHLMFCNLYGIQLRMKLLIVLSALLVISGVLAQDEFDNLEDLDLDELDEDSLDEDEALLRMIEEKRIVSKMQEVFNENCFTKKFYLKKQDLHRENQHARDMASKYRQQQQLGEGEENEPMRTICKQLQ